MERDGRLDRRRGRARVVAIAQPRSLRSDESPRAGGGGQSALGGLIRQQPPTFEPLTRLLLRERVRMGTERALEALNRCDSKGIWRAGRDETESCYLIEVKLQKILLRSVRCLRPRQVL
jgi:hypothetical protein